MILPARGAATPAPADRAGPRRRRDPGDRRDLRLRREDSPALLLRRRGARRLISPLSSRNRGPVLPIYALMHPERPARTANSREESHAISRTVSPSRQPALSRPCCSPAAAASCRGPSASAASRRRRRRRPASSTRSSPPAPSANSVAPVTGPGPAPVLPLNLAGPESPQDVISMQSQKPQRGRRRPQADGGPHDATGGHVAGQGAGDGRGDRRRDQDRREI